MTIGDATSSEGTSGSGGARIDWSVAVSLGQRLSPRGPLATQFTFDEAATELIDAAHRAEGPVRAVTGLADGLPIPTARALTRGEWIGAAAESMDVLIGAHGPAPAGIKGVFAAVGAKAAGAQAGSLLAFLSTAILGQYDPFAENGAGRLLLVTPNVIHVERTLALVPSDFRLWVALHEVTHRVQFSANPWLRDYMRENVAAITDGDTDTATALLGRLTAKKADAAERQPGLVGAMEVLQTPQQHRAFTNLLMLGTLLEGHADHVMDAVGPEVVPTVATIRAAFDKRRQSPRNPITRLLRALLGLDAKIAQYVRGKAFVDEVVGSVGMEYFNRVWASAETLPLPAEIAQPQLWIDRVR